MPNQLLKKSRYTISKMFDLVAPRYDLLNRLMSFGQDVVWRKRLATLIPQRPNLRALDLATGTADSLLMVLKMPQAHVIQSATGLDISNKMLELARKKVANSIFSDKVHLALGDATQIEMADHSIDLVTMAFGIRNVDSLENALSEIYRVLDEKGRVLILEFSMPLNPIVQSLYLFYFRYVLPNIAGLISGQKKAYHYLNKSSENFPHGEQFCQYLKGAGFQNVRALSLCLGVATIYQGDKP